MRKIALAIAALAIAGFAAPTMQSANAETIVVKKSPVITTRKWLSSSTAVATITTRPYR
jgi:hypothetical protein